jgi:hypothetical protein
VKLEQALDQWIEAEDDYELNKEIVFAGVASDAHSRCVHHGTAAWIDSSS